MNILILITLDKRNTFLFLFLWKCFSKLVSSGVEYDADYKSKARRMHFNNRQNEEM